MNETVKNSTIGYLIASILLLFYNFDSQWAGSQLIKSLYFIKGDVLITVLLMYMLNKVGRKLKPILYSGIVYSSLLVIYEYLIVNLKESLYTDFIKNDSVSILISLMTLATYSITSIYNNRHDREYRVIPIFKGGCGRIKKWLRKATKIFSKEHCSNCNISCNN